METNEYEEPQAQMVEKDEQLEKAIARNEKLRTVAFEKVSKFITDDRNSAILSTILLTVLLAGLLVGYGWLCSNPHLFKEGNFSILHGILLRKASLFHVSMALFFLGSLTNLIYSLLIHNKLNVKNMLSEDASVSVPRIRTFCKNNVIRTIISGAFLLLGLVFLCAWLIMVFRSVPTASKGEVAEAVAFIVSAATILILIGVIAGFVNTKYFSSQCDELIALLEI